MATVIQIKRSSGSTAPTTGALAEGELAYAQDQSGSGASAKLYIESLGSDGSTPVVHAIGGKFYTDAVDAATDSNTASAIVKRDGSGDFSAGTITANLTGNADTASAWATARTITLAGDLSGSVSIDGSGDVTLTGSVTGADATELTGVVKAANGTTVLNNGTDGTDATFTGDVTGDLTGAVTGNVTGDLTGNVTGNVTGDVTGDVTSSGTSSFTTVDINGGTIDGTAIGGTTTAAGSFTTLGSSGDLSVGANATITGNLTVNGTTTTVATANTVVSDTLLELGNGTTSAANDSGLIIERGNTGDNAFIGWDESADKFTVGTTTATGASTGDLAITVGTLVATIEGNVTGNLTGDVTGSLSGGTVSGLSAAIGVADGGTGAGTFTSNGIVYGNGTGALQVTAAGTDGYILYSNSGTPAWTNTLDGGSY